MRYAALVVCLAVVDASAAIQDAMPGVPPGRLLPQARFDAATPTPFQVLGFETGMRPMRHGELMRYLEALDAASPRAVLRAYTRSYEGRALVEFIVSDEATIGRLDAFREEHTQRNDPRRRSAGAESDLETAKAVAWMAYGIHGDELSSTDAAAVLAYWLVSGEDELARRLRHDLVILIDPCENPDGRERFLSQTTSFAHSAPSPDTNDLSHTTVWPWGRGNHYLFDLNRDWFTLVQPESRRVSEIAGWNPQVVVDSHEMGADDSYLFSPPRHPFNPHLPAVARGWADRFAADQARALDARGYGYYTREWNEEFFPGYGSSWAAYRGAIGILYEMSSTEGTLVKQSAGITRSYAQAVEHQLTSSVANLTTLVDHRAEILRDGLRSRREAIARVGGARPGAWVFPRGSHPERSDALAALLRQQGIEVWLSRGHAGLSGLRDARTGENQPAERLAADAWVVPLDQPAGPLARAILDPHVPMEAPFFREQREYLERGKGSRLYDVTSWSLPLAYGIEAYWTLSLPPAGSRSEDAVPDPQGGFVRGDAAYAYLLDGTSDRSVPALADLLQRGINVRVAEKPFRVDGRAYASGALLIKREGAPADLEAQLAQLAERWKVELRPARTAKAEDGPDLGGGHFLPLLPPRIGVWTGMGVSPSPYGALWFLFDEQLRLRFTALDLARADGADLSRFNVLIFPPDFGGAYRAAFGGGSDRLKRWIEAGGTAIGIGGGAEFLADADAKLTRTRLRRQALDRYPPVVVGLGPEEAESAGAFRAVGIRAPEPPAEKADAAKRAKEPPAVKRASPYDVAPLLGPGARPFAAGFEQGTPANLKPIDLQQWLKPFLPPGKSQPDKEQLEWADERLRRFGPRGTFVRVELNPDAWLAWGLSGELPALINDDDTLVAEPPVQVAARFADVERLHLGGLLWPEAAGRLARTAYATREGVGRGQVILFLNEPEFRGWTLATRRLLTNAVLLGPGVGTSWSAPW
ncbi:MAG TPA: M14 family zinc carboxypeptidase [Candidatus Polarisedimenticolaceae bacterium]|nr:M14 family zinc carboxypeptidase [Candidatus Polarisedimenticolaceae bacterium]